MVTVCKKDYLYVENRSLTLGNLSKHGHLFLAGGGMVIICMVTKVSMVTYF